MGLHSKRYPHITTISFVWLATLKNYNHLIHNYLDEVDTLDDVDIEDDVDTELEVDTLKIKTNR